MISFDTATCRFNLRAVAIIRRGSSVLLPRLAHDQFWSLPGGRVEPGEAAAEAVIRELREESGLWARVGDLTLVVENFYSHADKAHHEVGLYFNVEFEPNAMPYGSESFEGKEGHHRLIFQWFSESALATLDVRPSVLMECLAQDAGAFRHVVCRTEG